MKTNKLWSEDEKQLLHQLHKEKTYPELALLFNCTEYMVRYQLEKQNLNKGHYKRTVNWMLNDELETFYWIGFLLADGCFIKERLIFSKLSVLLSANDENHLQILANKLNVSISKRKILNSFSDGDMVQLSASDSVLMPEICNKFDIKERKTYNPPDFSKYNFSDDQMLALIIGFIDGDGAITCTNDKIQLSIFVHNSWENNIIIINDFLHEKFCSIRENSIKYIDNKVGFSLGKRRIFKNIKHFIVENNIPVLMRKWGKIKSEKFSQKSTKSNRSTENIISKKSVTIEGKLFESKSEAQRYFSCSRDLIEKHILGQE